MQVPLITCRADTAVSAAVDMMLSRGVHRVYVVDEAPGEAGKPIAVVTATDLVAFFCNHLPDP